MTITIDRKRLAEFKTIELKRGAHEPDHTFCVMEAVAYVAGEKWSDRPKCASPLLTDFCISWNDAMSDEDRQILKPYIPRLVNTVASKEVELKRSWMALDWYCRVSAPAWLDRAGLKAEAKAIRATSPIVDAKTAKAAQAALERARQAAYVAGAAARAAAGAAARDAAGAAAWDAARAAAGDAAWAAAWAAAGAGDVAGAAARAALRPTVVALQKSALKLLSAMIEAA